MKFNPYVTTLVIGWIALLAVVSSEAQETPTRSIVEIGENLYRAQNNIHYTVFLVTEEGIVLADPINTDFSVWLKNELAERFDVPVRYVLYSHHHSDHASGGAVFRDSALFVSHENSVRGLELGPSDTPLEGDAAAMDANGDGRLQRGETSGFRESLFDLFDFDEDGEISGAESARGPANDVVVPDLTYKDRMTITLGGKDVELIYAGAVTHSDDLSIIRFPGARVMFGTDFVVGRQVPGWPVGRGLLDAWINAIRLAEALEYEVFAPGHGVVGTKANVAANRHYLEELRDAVASGIAAGASLEEMQNTILMESYQNWARYDQVHRRNVEGMYLMLTE